VHTTAYTSQKLPVDLAKQCEMKFVYEGEDKQQHRMKGIVLCRLIPGAVTPYDVVNLLATEKGSPQLCTKCSKLLQRPEFHHKKECKFKSVAAAEKQVFLKNFKYPDYLDICGPQQYARSKPSQNTVHL